jgi:LPXTG-motif cell wall-anchored protein
MEFARPNPAAIRIVRRGLGVSAVVATTAIVWFAVANPAEAHTPKVKAECYRGQAVLLVELSNYSDSRSNNITVQDGTTTIRDARFGRSFREIWTRPGTEDHTFKVKVKAWDDPRGDKGFSFSKTLTVPSCAPKPPAPKPPAGTTTTTTTTPPAETTTSKKPIVTLPPLITTSSKEKEKEPEKEKTQPTTTTTTTTTTAVPTTTTKRSTPSFQFTTTTTKAFVPVGNETNLPNTGASIAIPALVGLCLLTAGGMVLFSARQRKRGRHAAW